MSRTTTITGDQLANALRALGVHFIMGGDRDADQNLHKYPSRLIAALAQSNEARLRLSLIPLFLEHPEYAKHVRTVAKKLDSPARLTLQCYYTAAVWLAKKYRLDTSLPDYFSKDLNLTPVEDHEVNLHTLAKRHQELSGKFVNWLATYQQAEHVWKRGFEHRKRATHLISNATDSPLPLGEGLGVRSNLTKRQSEVTIFAAEAGTLEGSRVGKVIETKDE